MEFLVFLGIGSLMELITYLILIAAGIIFILNNRTSIFKGKYETLVQIAQIAVGAAEQMAEKKGWTGPDKFKYVFDLITSHNENLSNEEITAIIEDAVYRLTGKRDLVATAYQLLGNQLQK